jgi:hypothetical protein
MAEEAQSAIELVTGLVGSGVDAHNAARKGEIVTAAFATTDVVGSGLNAVGVVDPTGILRALAGAYEAFKTAVEAKGDLHDKAVECEKLQTERKEMFDKHPDIKMLAKLYLEKADEITAKICALDNKQQQQQQQSPPQQQPWPPQQPMPQQPQPQQQGPAWIGRRCWSWLCASLCKCAGEAAESATARAGQVAG